MSDMKNDELLQRYKLKVKETSRKYLEMIDAMYAEKHKQEQSGKDVGAREEYELRKQCDEELRKLAEEYKTASENIAV